MTDQDGGIVVGLKDALIVQVYLGSQVDECDITGENVPGNAAVSIDALRGQNGDLFDWKTATDVFDSEGIDKILADKGYARIIDWRNDSHSYECFVLPTSK